MHTEVFIHESEGDIGFDVTAGKEGNWVEIKMSCGGDSAADVTIFPNRDIIDILNDLSEAISSAKAESINRALKENDS